MTNPAISNQSCTVLLVEDNPIDARLTKHALASAFKAHCRVEHVSQLSDALERLAGESIDVALVDLSLPDSYGLETFRRLSSAAESVPIVVLTSLDDEHLAIGLLQQGAQDYLLKQDIEPKLLARSIRYAIERNRATILQAKAERELARLNDDLEHLIAERTAELAAANQTLAEASRENEMFIYSVSHDLRSPLVNLQGFSRELTLACQEARDILATSDITPAARQRGMLILDQQIAESTQFIQSAVMRLSKDIDSLLRMSRIGRAEYNWQSVDLQRLVAEIVNSRVSPFATASVQLKVHELPPAWGDVLALEQLFANLVGNALKFLDPARPGVIEIGSTSKAHRPQPKEDYYTYYVRDNGRGIPSAYQARLFKIFQRLHADVAEGDGMGLAIVRRVVGRHGGDVWIESTEGIGTTVFVTLPRALRKPQCNESALVAPFPLGTLDAGRSAVATMLCLS